MLLDYNEIHKKQKISGLYIAESRVKRSGQFHIFNSMINVFIFRCTEPET